jgi:hypothetical protein
VLAGSTPVLVHNCGGGEPGHGGGCTCSTGGQPRGPNGQFLPSATPRPQSSGVHGNSLNSPRVTYLYRLEDLQGNYLKTGITDLVNPRYSQGFLADKNMIFLTSGTRREMVNLERFIVERDPGPLNFEDHAGAFAWDVPS